jgi:hypothetical protein
MTAPQNTDRDDASLGAICNALAQPLQLFGLGKIHRAIANEQPRLTEQISTSAISSGILWMRPRRW